MIKESVSFCVVTFNNVDRIEKLVNNLIEVLDGRITYKLYVVDNGSTDGTTEIIDKLKQKNRNIILYEQKNVGFGAGHNSVMGDLKSTYHVVINPDVQITSFVEISKMISFLKGHKNVGLLSPLILNTDGSIQRLYKREPTVFDLLIRFVSPNFFKKRQNEFVRMESGYKEIGRIDYASGAFMMFRTEIFKAINGFDERYFMYMEDADITRKVNKIATSVFYPKAFVIHEWQRESHKKIKYVIYSVVSLCKYFSKWGWKYY